MIRKATKDDINSIVELGIMVWSETRYAEYDLDIDKVWAFVDSMIGYEDGIVLVAENSDGEIIGGIVAELFTQWFGNSRAAQDLAIFIKQEHRGSPTIIKLINKYKETAQELGAKDIMIGISSGLKIDKAETLFKRLGFKQVGSLFSLECA